MTCFSFLGGLWMRKIIESSGPRSTARAKRGSSPGSVPPTGFAWHQITARECRDEATGSPAILISEIQRLRI